MPLSATLFLGYALLGAGVFLFSMGARTFLQESSAPLLAHPGARRRRGVTMARAVGSLVVATLLLLAATIVLVTAMERLLL